MKSIELVLSFDAADERSYGTKEWLLGEIIFVATTFVREQAWDVTIPGQHLHSSWNKKKVLLLIECKHLIYKLSRVIMQFSALCTSSKVRPHHVWQRLKWCKRSHFKDDFSFDLLFGLVQFNQ